MSDFLKNLQERRASAFSRAKEIMDAAGAENRDLTAEEQEQLRAFDADMDNLDGQIKETTDRLNRAAAADAVREIAMPILRAQGAPESDKGIVRSVLLDGRSKIAMPGMDVRALATSTSTVASAFYDQVVVYARTLNPTYAISRVLRTSNGETITVPRLTADVAGNVIVGQGTAITPADPTISSITLSAYDIKSLTYWSAELAQDNAVNLDELVAMSAGRDIGLAAGSQFTLADGSDKPNGFINAASNGGTATGTPFFTADDLIALYFELAAPYRGPATGAWQASTGAVKKMRQFKDNSGQYLYAVNVGSPDTFMGKPVYENPHMAAPASASKSVAFGDWNQFFVREVAGMRVERSTDYRFNTDEIALKVVWRVDSDLPDTAAIKYLVSANT